ncbi:MCE family protein [Haloechinothrix sp. YIM 98757]|uniref:MCE family protein n=1 Tax=Haloechinothrix aidingensis TaxID=2752311 RepID=A0A838AC64_9PSEU|nr:MlaD family protein [Haloechinothrix aidingensis]MBA0126852.1 MCE family protein [Haloechinothrix aidingensis]
MRIPTSILGYLRLAVVLAFVALCAGVFVFLWTGAGGRIPLVSEEGYRVSLDVPTVDNLVHASDVMADGVEIGSVVEIETEQDHARVTVELDDEYAPLHEGAAVTVRYKTLLQETFLQIDDGDGEAIPAGSALPEGSAEPAVDLNDVLVSLDQPTREALAGTLRSLGMATDGTAEQISATLRGLGHMGRQGETVLDALADQSTELRELSGNAATLLSALDTRQGQIAQLVGDAEKLTEVTANGNEHLEDVMRKLPGLLDTARGASDDLERLGEDLGPVAANLDAAAPDLTAALRQLPETSADLRGLLPHLDSVLKRAPETLERIPPVGEDVRSLLPHASTALADVNPMLAYLRPYGQDLAAWFATTADAADATRLGGHHVPFTVVPNEQSVAGIPGGTNDLSPRVNPYPGPGQAERPAPFEGSYPRVEEGN